jgi:RNA polymerase sigma-70 factor (ECF subfamily)
VQAPTNVHEDRACFQRFIEGDDAAFLMLFKKYNQRLYVYALKIVEDADQASDIVQEMWERIVMMRTAPQEVGNPGGLFLRVTRNLCIDHLRARRPLLPLEDIEESAQFTYTTHEPSELEELALESLNKLSFEYREVLVLNLYCGYRFDEIAAMTGKTPDAVWARASRARAQLRKMVAAAIGQEEPTNQKITSKPRQVRTERKRS